MLIIRTLFQQRSGSTALYCRSEKEKFRMNFTNKYVPDYVPENLLWHKRDTLLTWYDQAKCKDFLDNTDEHFEKTKIANFDIINKSLKKETISKKSF